LQSHRYPRAESAANARKSTAPRSPAAPVILFHFAPSLLAALGTFLAWTRVEGHREVLTRHTRSSPRERTRNSRVGFAKNSPGPAPAQRRHLQCSVEPVLAAVPGGAGEAAASSQVTARPTGEVDRCTGLLPPPESLACTPHRAARTAVRSPWLLLSPAPARLLLFLPPLLGVPLPLSTQHPSADAAFVQVPVEPSDSALRRYTVQWVGPFALITLLGFRRWPDGGAPGRQFHRTGLLAPPSTPTRRSRPAV